MVKHDNIPMIEFHVFQLICLCALITFNLKIMYYGTVRGTGQLELQVTGQLELPDSWKYRTVRDTEQLDLQVTGQLELPDS